MAVKRKAPLLQWTDDDACNTLIAQDPMALLIGFCLDQQITVEKAFSGPMTIIERLGTIDAAKLARMDPAKVEKAFATPPAVHRYPNSMAGRVQSMCSLIATEYNGDAAAIWETAKDGADLRKRLAALPGFGAIKSLLVLAVLVKQFGVTLKGADALLPTWPTLGDVNTADQRREYQANKRAHKARLRAEAAPKAPAGSPTKRLPRATSPRRVRP